METKMEPLTPPHTPPTLDRSMHHQQQLQITSPRWIRSQQLSARFGQQHSTGQSYQAAFLDNWLRGAALLAVRGCCPQTTSPHSYHQQGHQGVHPALPVPPPASFLARRLPGQRPKKQFICKFLYSSTLYKSKSLVEWFLANRYAACSSFLLALESKRSIFVHVGETEKKRRCRDTRCSYGPDNGPFIRHCIPGTLIVSLKPDNLRGYETAPPSSFSYLVLPFPFWHPFVCRSPYWQGLIKGEQKMSKEERRCLFFGPTPARGVSGVPLLQSSGRGSFQLLVKLHQGVPWPSNGPECPLAIPDGPGNALIPARSSLKFKLI